MAFVIKYPKILAMNIMKVYLARDGVQAGPYTLDELNRMLASGEVALTDLMWHSGMSQWQSVGQMTEGAYTYQPKTVPTLDTQTTQNPQEPRGFGDNVDLNPPQSDTPKRVSVAQLYGQKPIENQPSQPFSTSQSTTPSYQVSRQAMTDDTIEYASVGARFGAFAINVGLYLLTFAPLIVAFMQVIDPNELAKLTDYASMQSYSQSLVDNIPTTTMAMSNVMILVLIGVQLLLIIMRGQSFGKMAMGIRVIDEKSGKLPSFGTRVFLRTFLLVVLYIVGASAFSGFPALIMLVMNYVMASNNDKKQGWHDKFTKTITVKAKPIQLNNKK